MFLHLEMSSVRRRLQCWTRRNKDLEGLKDQEIREAIFLRGHKYSSHGVICCSPVSDVITTREVKMLESEEIRCSLCNPMVADSWAVVEGQAGEAAAVQGY